MIVFFTYLSYYWECLNEVQILIYNQHKQKDLYSAYPSTLSKRRPYSILNNNIKSYGCCSWRRKRGMSGDKLGRIKDQEEATSHEIVSQPPTDSLQETSKLQKAANGKEMGENSLGGRWHWNS